MQVPPKKTKMWEMSPNSRSLCTGVINQEAGRPPRWIQLQDAVSHGAQPLPHLNLHGRAADDPGHRHTILVCIKGHDGVEVELHSQKMVEFGNLVLQVFCI